MPTETGEVDADVIVVGAGLGGSAAAWQLVEHGLSVLVLEAGTGGPARLPGFGQRFASRVRAAFGQPAALDSEHYSYFTRETEDSGRLRPVPTRQGRGLGGSSALYAAALGRFKRSDFVTSRASPSADRALPNAWPIDYDAFVPYYHRAEALMRVRGERDPGDVDDDSRLLPPPPLSPAAQAVREALLWNGHLPYRLHVGIDYVDGCTECFGFRCALGCKADGYNRALERALATGLARLECGQVASTVEAEPGGTVRVSLADAAGRCGERRARRVVLAAGALGTPLLLERSLGLWRGARPAMLGRGLMFHVSDSFVLMAPGAAGGGPRKWLGLRDFYDDGTVDLGEVQSTGFNLTTGHVMQLYRSRAARILGGWPLPLAEFLRPVAWLVARVIGPRPIFATITEDLPYASNRVELDRGRIAAVYRTDPHLRQHARAMRTWIREAFAPIAIRFLGRPGTPNWGHPMGTCRMGDDPATSVTAPDGRLHGASAIYVADASVFPCSGSTGPGLTVVAHALRVADRIGEEIGRRSTAEDAAAL